MGLPLVSEDRALVTFVANPSCPRGLLASGAGLRAGPGLRVVDEAFMGFTDERESLVDRAAHDPDLIVLRSLTKLYALPGLRIGYLVAHPERIARLRERQPPWSVNGLAQAAGIAAIGDVEYARRAPALVRELREALVRDLSSFGIAPEPSDANYVLCPVDRAGELCRRLLERRVAIRDCSSFEGLAHDRFVRIAVPDDAGRARLMRALEEIRA